MPQPPSSPKKDSTREDSTSAKHCEVPGDGFPADKDVSTPPPGSDQARKISKKFDPNDPDSKGRYSRDD